ncbi:hypothetical protein [Paraferrimonas sedimenticola]|uniref:Uncharacterized protein n=1 Tax=Paraferrimonas sedimenticola TaxID=375674 RepID=A0AA37RTP9_9GAMM|nr:hypothetical protein [Paraferrimonas sedimenticola]GLP95510.1 hypothetical protein GCM10007895_08160 [Paraferrimonas sedimenticola]
MSDKPSDFQQKISGEWHGYPCVFEADGSFVGANKVSRESSFKNGQATYWIRDEFDTNGPLRSRMERGEDQLFGVVDSDKDRIYTGPDFIGSGQPFGNLVNSYYYSPYWNYNLHTLNQTIPELGLQAYSSQMYEGNTLVAVMNGLYINTESGDESPETQAKIADWQVSERELGRTPHTVPVKHAGVWVGEFDVYDMNQEYLGKNRVVIEHKPVNMLHAEQTVTIEGVINRKFKSLRVRKDNNCQYLGPDVYGNGTGFGRYMFAQRHFFGESGHLFSREIIVNDNKDMACVYQFYASGQPVYMTYGLLRWTEKELVLGAEYL